MTMVLGAYADGWGPETWNESGGEFWRWVRSKGWDCRVRQRDPGRAWVEVWGRDPHWEPPVRVAIGDTVTVGDDGRPVVTRPVPDHATHVHVVEDADSDAGTVTLAGCTVCPATWGHDRTYDADPALAGKVWATDHATTTGHTVWLYNDGNAEQITPPEPPIKTGYTRAELIELAHDACQVPKNAWSDRDTPGALEQAAHAWQLLNAGCDYTIDTDDKALGSRRRTVWVWITHPTFGYYDHDADPETTLFYLPTRERLNERPGQDWY